MPDPLLIQSAQHNILIEQGQPFYRIIKIKNNGIYVNLLPYGFKSEIRREESINSDLITQIQCIVNAINPTELILSIPNTSTIRSNFNGVIPNNFTVLQPEKLPSNLYHWSVRSFVSDVPISRVIKGKVLVSPEITAA